MNELIIAGCEYRAKTGATLVPRLVDEKKGTVMYTNSASGDLHEVSAQKFAELLEIGNELRDEIELPPMDYGLAAHEQCDVRERQLKSSLEANREQKAEIERLKALSKQLHEVNFRQAAKINSIIGARAEFADTLLKLFGYTMYTEEYENASIVDEVRAAIVRADQAETELASLRASVGEKWIAYNEGVEAAAVAVEEGWDGWDGVAARIRREKHPVAPTLPGEEK